MSFKFFRKHEKVMLWVIVVITVLTFSLFSVSSALRTFFGQEEKSFGTFVSKTGDEVYINPENWGEAYYLWQKFPHLRYNGEDREADIVSIMICLHEARAAGIMVTDADIQAQVKQMGLTTKEQYQQVVKTMFRSVREFEEGLKKALMVSHFRDFRKAQDSVVTTEELFEYFKINNEEFKVAYVSFPKANYKDRVDPATIKEEDVKTYYDGLDKNSTEVIKDFSESEKFEFDTAYLNLIEADFENYKDLVDESAALTDAELRRHYELTKERFVVEKKEDEEPETPKEEEKETPEQDEPKEEEKPAKTYKPFEEVKPQLDKEMRLASLVKQANIEWGDYLNKTGLKTKTWEEIVKERDEAKKKKEEEEAKKAEEEKKDEKGETPEEEIKDKPEEAMNEENQDKPETENKEEKKEDDLTELSPDAFMDQLVAKYRLLRKKVTGPVSLDDIPSLETIGCDQLKNIIRTQKVNYGGLVMPNADRHELALFFRVTQVVERAKKPFEAVKEKAKEAYVEHSIIELAKNDSQGFFDALKEKARGVEEAKKAIDEIQADAAKAAEELIKAKEEITEEEKDKIREDELKKYDADIEDLLKRHLYKSFDEEAKARSLEVKTVDYFRKTAFRDMMDQEDSPEKFVKSHHDLFRQDTNSVTEPAEDRKTNDWYVMRILDRRFPAPASMTKKDEEDSRKQLSYQLNLRKQYPQFPIMGLPEKPDAFAKDVMLQKYKVTFFKTEEAAEEETQQPEEETMAPAGPEEAPEESTVPEEKKD